MSREYNAAKRKFSSHSQKNAPRKFPPVGLVSSVIAHRSLQTKLLLSQCKQLMTQLSLERQENRTLLVQDYRERRTIANYSSADVSYEGLSRRYAKETKSLQDELRKKRDSCVAIERQIRHKEVEMDRAQLTVKRYQSLIENTTLADEETLRHKLSGMYDSVTEKETCIKVRLCDIIVYQIGLTIESIALLLLLLLLANKASCLRLLAEKPQ